MSSTIRIKRSSVRGKVPNTSNISTGELALNLVDKRLYSSNGTATFEIGSNPHSLTVGSGTFSFANGALTLPTADGTSGQVLQTDGAGNITFGASSSALSVLSPQKLDSISAVDGQAAYTMQISGTNHSPLEINALVVSLNGIIQEPGTDFTIEDSTITFSPALQTGDVIDFIIDLGRAIGVTATSFTLEPVKLDSITTNGNTAYTLLSGNSAYTPTQQNGLLVSINGVIQEPGTSFTVANNTITFGQALQSDDTIDFIVDYTGGGTMYVAEKSGIVFKSVTVNNSITFSGSTVTGSFVPITNDLYDIGSSNNNWNFVYANTFVGDGSRLTNITADNYLQVANAVSTYATIDTVNANLANTNAYIATKADTSSLASVATSGSFNDLIDTPYANTIGSGSYSSTKYILNGTSTSNTEIELFKLGTSSRISVTGNTTVFYDISFAARRTDATGESASWQLKGCIDNFSGTVADVGDVYEIAIAQDDVTWAVDARADSGNTALGIYARGATGKTVKWTALVETVEVKQ